MKQKTKVIFFIILSTAFVLTFCVLPSEAASKDKQTLFKARVISVVDGDTIKVQFYDEIPLGFQATEKVRLIGVNTPELTTTPPEYFAQEARDYTNSILYLQTVYLEFDSVSARKDKYGRMLAYVYRDTQAISINQELIEKGFGYYYGVFAFNLIQMVNFKNAEQYAKSNKLGLWK